MIIPFEQIKAEREAQQLDAHYTTMAVQAAAGDTLERLLGHLQASQSDVENENLSQGTDNISTPENGIQRLGAEREEA